jgi:hypothetical protein
MKIPLAAMVRYCCAIDRKMTDTKRTREGAIRQVPDESSTSHHQRRFAILYRSSRGEKKKKRNDAMGSLRSSSRSQNID